MTCQVCGYHSGPLTPGEYACPRVHLYKPRPPVQPHRVGCLCCLCADLRQEADDIGAHHYEMEQTDGPR